MDVDALGGQDRRPGRHEGPGEPEGREGPRTVVVLVVAALLGLLAVGGVFWLVTSGLGGSPSGGAAAAAPAVVSTSESSTTTPDDGPTTITSTLTSTSRTTTPSPTLDLPPPELPTYTLAPKGTAPAGSTTAPAPSRTTAAPPPTTAPAQPRVTNAQLSCKRARNAVKGTLSFTTTAPVQAYLVGGGKVASGIRGPGAVTMTVNGGDGAGYCLATVGGQTLGPVPAR